jgi:hypothetical protein
MTVLRPNLPVCPCLLMVVQSLIVFPAGKLTQWGYNDCTRHLNNGAFGSTFPKCMSELFVLPTFLIPHTVLQRNLPRNYPYNNTYSLFPLTCPTTTRNLLKSSADSRDQYDFERPRVRNVKIIETKKAISFVFNKPSVYQTSYGEDFETLTDGYG